MPVNMDPTKKRRRFSQAQTSTAATSDAATAKPEFGGVTADDEEKDLAEAESKNLWDATEVIDMDTF
ncbi:MAG: hypothetical protein KF814_02705 [Nitrospiraceae bacterium]|nr:hypothetical protein [Nitrospiraceae bacterium]